MKVINRSSNDGMCGTNAKMIESDGNIQTRENPNQSGEFPGITVWLKGITIKSS